MAPGYYILGGRKPYEGAIIARDRQALAEMTTMSQADKNGWYILETNYDHSKPTLYLDDRRTPGNRCMQLLQRANVGFEGLFNVLASKTTLNKETEYTLLMQVDDGRLETHLQYCPQPCWFA